MRLGVIFQGGGAKFVTLLAAAEVIEEIAADSPDIEIAATAGTSAGAFAAYALASPSEAPTFRPRARLGGIKLLPKLNFLNNPGFFTRARKAIAISRGRTIAPSGILEEFVREFVPRSEIYLKDTSLPVYICATDLANGKMVTFSSYNTNDRVSEALADSAAIPVFFRSVVSGRQFIDGGICANLPDETVFKAEDRVDAVLALSFDEEDFITPVSLFSFLGAMVSTSIDHSIEKAADRIERAGGAVVRLSRMFGTLDFNRAMETLADENMFKTQKDLVRQRISQELGKLSSKRSATSQPPTKRPRIVRSDDPLYLALRRLRPFRCVRSEVRALGFTLSGLHGMKDELVHIVSYCPTETNAGEAKDGLAYVRIGIANLSVNDVAQMGVVIRDRNGRSIPTTSVVLEAPLGDGNSSQKQYFYLHIFDEIIPTKDTPITVTQTVYIDDLLGDLRRHGVDAFRSKANVRDAPEHFMYVATPKDFGRIRLTELHESEHRLNNPRALSDLEASRTNWSFGRALSSDEVRDVRAEVRARHADFEVAGWHISSAKENTWMGCLIEKTS